MAVANPGNSIIDVASLPPEMAMMRLENDNIQAMACARPRDYEEIKRSVISQIKAFPAFAANIIYCKPVGKDEDNVMQFARNLSIRAAECLAEAYGYNRVASTITPIDDDHAGVEAIFVDYQRGRIWQDRRVVSRVYKGKGGISRRHPDDRFYGIVCAAEASRRIREVILRSVPPGLKQELFDAAEKEMAKLLTAEEMKRIVAAFASKGVTIDKLEQYIGRTQKAGWTAADRQRLAETWAAIKNEEATVAEIFGEGESRPGAASAQNGHGAENRSGEVSAEDLMNPKGGAEAKPEDETKVKSSSKTPPKETKPKDDEPLPPNPKGQVGPEKPADADPVLEREPGDDSDADAGYAQEGETELPAWAQNICDELQAADGIRQMKAIGEKFSGDPERTDSDRDWITSVVEEAQEQVRKSRGTRSNPGEQTSFA